jgi:hypothetical protein
MTFSKAACALVSAFVLLAPSVRAETAEVAQTPQAAAAADRALPQGGAR